MHGTSVVIGMVWDFNGPFVWAGLCLGTALFLQLLMWFAYTRRGEQILDVFWRLLHGRYLLGAGDAPGGELQPWMLWVLTGLLLLAAVYFAAKGWGIL